MKIILWLTASLLILSNSEAKIKVTDYEKVILDCISQNLDYFFYGKAFTATIVQYDKELPNKLTVHFTYRSGTASASIFKLTEDQYIGKGLFTDSISIVKNDDHYLFNSKDSYDGLFNFKDIKLDCK